LDILSRLAPDFFEQLFVDWEPPDVGEEPVNRVEGTASGESSTQNVDAGQFVGRNE
jgi:hypothetical protein